MEVVDKKYLYIYIYLFTVVVQNIYLERNFSLEDFYVLPTELNEDLLPVYKGW